MTLRILQILLFAQGEYPLPFIILGAYVFLQLQRCCLLKTILFLFLSSWSERLNSVSQTRLYSAKRRTYAFRLLLNAAYVYVSLSLYHPESL